MNASTGNALARARMQAGLTQRAASDRSGVTERAISEAELGKSKPTLATLSKLASAYNTSVEALLKAKG